MKYILKILGYLVILFAPIDAFKILGGYFSLYRITVILCFFMIVIDVIKNKGIIKVYSEYDYAYSNNQVFLKPLYIFLIVLIILFLCLYMIFYFALTFFWKLQNPKIPHYRRLSKSTNDAIYDGIEKGVITSTNVMVNMPYFEEAVKLRKEFSKVSIGLHWNLTTGFPLSDQSEVPTLVDDNGEFRCLKTGRDIWRMGSISAVLR